VTARAQSLEVVVARSFDGHMDADVRQHRIVIDESAKYGGADRGANPVELMLAGLASASLVIIDIVAGRHVTSGVSLQVRAELNVDRIRGLGEAEPLLAKVELLWEVPPGRDPDEIRELLPDLASRRPGQALLDSAGTAVEAVVVANEREEPAPRAM
jgi:hypothetical protein